MLVLSCRRDEVIVLRDHATITVHVIELRGDRVRLGITAPPAVLAYRGDIWQRLLRSGRLPTTDRAEELDARAAALDARERAVAAREAAMNTGV